MTKKIESGKARLITGSLLYLWEEIKTMNRTKLRALSRIVSGYFKLKVYKHHKVVNRHNLDLSLDEN